MGVSPFVRKVKTASGATAVQIVEKRNGRRRILEHVGSAHDEAELAVLDHAARFTETVVDTGGLDGGHRTRLVAALVAAGGLDLHGHRRGGHALPGAAVEDAEAQGRPGSSVTVGACVTRSTRQAGRDALG